jgi:hypothetical protein
MELNEFLEWAVLMMAMDEPEITANFLNYECAHKVNMIKQWNLVS